MIADIVIISIILLFAVIGFNRGIAKTLLNFAGLILSLICAYYLSNLIAQFVYDSLLRDNVIENIEQLINEKGMEYALLNSLEAAPEWISAIISAVVGLFGITLKEFEQNMDVIPNMSSSVASSIEGAISSVIVTVITVILATVLFIILFILIKRLIKLVDQVFRIPVVKQVNQVLGFVLGGLEGIVFVWFAVNLFYAIMSFTEPSTIQNSMLTGDIFRFFCIAL